MEASLPKADQGGIEKKTVVGSSRCRKERVPGGTVAII
jgi:hypothetical protein